MKRKEIKLTDVIGDKQTLSELWVSLASLSSHIVSDNESRKKPYKNVYPTSVRELQLESIKAIVSAIEEHSK